jgi:hypothetical protein
MDSIVIAAWFWLHRVHDPAFGFALQTPKKA